MRAALALFAVVLLGAGAYLALSPGPVGPGTPADALDRAWAHVHADPSDPAAWVRLGEVQAEADQLPAAEHAYRTALRLGDRSGLAYARLGFLLYGVGEDAEAKGLLLEARRRGAEVPLLDATLAALEATTASEPSAGPPRRAEATAAPPDLPRPVTRLDRDAGVPGPDAWVPPPPPPPPPPAPPPPPEAPPPRAPPAGPDVTAYEGPCTVPLRRRGRGVFLMDVTIQGVPARLIVDTGASITVVTEDLVARAGAQLDRRRVIRAITANGRVDMATAVVGPVDVGPMRADSLRVAACVGCVEGVADGLLGLDLQAAFRMRLDPTAGTIEFSGGECGPGGESGAP